MFGFEDLKLCGTTLLLVLGVLANALNLGVMLVQQWRSGGVKTLAVIICFISLSNILLQISTFALVGRGALPAGPTFLLLRLPVCVAQQQLRQLLVCLMAERPLLREGFELLLDSLQGDQDEPLHHPERRPAGDPADLLRDVHPFLLLHFHTKTLVLNVTEKAVCVIQKPLFPVWVNVNGYVVTFICYLTLMPSAVMLPTSLKMVVYLCRHSWSLQRKESGSPAAGWSAGLQADSGSGVGVPHHAAHHLPLLLPCHLFFRAERRHALPRLVVLLRGRCTPPHLLQQKPEREELQGGTRDKKKRVE